MSKELKMKANVCKTQIHNISAEDANWEYVGFKVYKLKQDQFLNIATEQGVETCIVLVSGYIDFKSNSIDRPNLGNRLTPFAKLPPYAIYIPDLEDISIKALSEEVEVAFCTSVIDTHVSKRLSSRVIEPENIEVLTRGFGNNQRLVHNILPETEPAYNLLVVEVFTDEGNTSSYPSHKHDDKTSEVETYLEESYYHRINPEQGFCFQRVYTEDRSLDEAFAVEDRDVVLVPKGYHPVATVAGYDSYYLNVMAGPIREWKFTWEEDHAWVNTDEYSNKHK